MYVELGIDHHHDRTGGKQRDRGKVLDGVERLVRMCDFVGDRRQRAQKQRVAVFGGMGDKSPADAAGGPGFVVHDHVAAEDLAGFLGEDAP